MLINNFALSISKVNSQNFEQTVQKIRYQDDINDFKDFLQYNKNNNLPNQNRYIYCLRQVYSALFEGITHVTNDQFNSFLTKIDTSKLKQDEKKKIYKWLLYCSCNASTLVDTNRTKTINKARHNILLNSCIYNNDQNIDNRINNLSSYIANLLLSSHNIQINNNANNDEKHNLIQQTIRNVIGDYGTFNASTTKNITNKKTLNYTIANYLIKDLMKLTINKFHEKETEIRESNDNVAIANAIFYMMRYIPASIEDSMYCNLCNTHNVNIDKNSIVDKNRIRELYNKTNSGFMRAFNIMQKFMNELNVGGHDIKNIIRVKLFHSGHNNGNNGTLLMRMHHVNDIVVNKILDCISK